MFASPFWPLLCPDNTVNYAVILTLHNIPDFPKQLMLYEIYFPNLQNQFVLHLKLPKSTRNYSTECHLQLERCNSFVLDNSSSISY
jgi:hypothetical protein